jgi:plastocyanin
MSASAPELQAPFRRGGGVLRPPHGRRAWTRRLLLMALAASLPLAALAGAAGEVMPVEVEIRDYRFEPAELNIRVGTVVRWVNRERRTSHSIRFDAPEIGESERLFPDESWEWRFDAPGVFAYGCGPHPEMRGSVTVTE